MKDCSGFFDIIFVSLNILSKRCSSLVMTGRNALRPILLLAAIPPLLFGAVMWQGSQSLPEMRMPALRPSVGTENSPEWFGALVHESAEGRLEEPDVRRMGAEFARHRGESIVWVNKFVEGYERQEKNMAQR
jgi:hypothetical protein